MTQQFLTKFFVASLIILGEGAFTSEANSRSDVVAVTIGNSIQALPAAFSDNPELELQLLLTHHYLAPKSSSVANNVLDHSIFFATNATEYSPSNPRAPPVPI